MVGVLARWGFGNKPLMNSEPNISVLTMGSDLDVTTVPRVRRAIDAAVDGGCLRIILNMSGASYVDSAGMGLIVSELRSLRARGGLLSLTNVSERVYHSLEIMRMIDQMPVSVRGHRVTELDPSVLPLWRTTLRVHDDGLAEARGRVEELLGSMRFSADDLYDMCLAVGEALGNAVDHTCEGGVLATVSAYPDRAIVEVTDCGQGFFPEDDEPVVPLYAERGRGIKLMRLLADSLVISQKPTGGTVVRLVKLSHPYRAVE